VNEDNTRRWHVRVGWTGHDPDGREPQEIGHAIVLQLRERGGSSGAPNADGICRTTFVVAGDSLQDAQEQALQIAEDALEGAGLVDVVPVWLEVLRRDEVMRREGVKP